MAPAKSNGGGQGDRIIPTYQALAEDIKAMGIDIVFGLMSDDTAVFAVTLDALGIVFHGARHENTAIGMAEGFSIATGRLGIAIIGRGPATANGLHAATFASRTGAKVLIIYGEEMVDGGALNTLGPDYKSFNANGVLSAAGLKTFVPTSAETARPMLADAAAAAMRGRAVTLNLPVNVQHANLQTNGQMPPVLEPTSIPAATPKAKAIETAAALLRNARKPLIVGGYGAFRAGAGEALEKLAERIGGLLVTSAKGKDMFRDSPYNMGIIGSFSHSAARRYAEQADCVIVFGAGLNFFTSSFGESMPDVPLIQVDANRTHIGRWLDADVAVVGDARIAAENLLEAIPDRPIADKPFHSEAVRQDLAAFDIANDFQPANTARTVDPRSLALELDRMLPKDRNMVYDAGNFLGVVPYISVPGPGHFKMTNDFASIGLGFGAALGFAKARPDTPTILVIGDGGFMMTMGELETVVREDLPLVIVVMNDCAYGAELHFLRMRQLPVAKSVFPDVDFAPIAAGFGFDAHTIRSLDALRELAPLLAAPDGPIFLDCKINADVAAPFMSEVAAFEARHEGD